MGRKKSDRARTGRNLPKCFEPTFSEFIYGSQPEKNARQAVEQAQRYIAEGYKYVMEMDLAKFFDTVDHGRLMAKQERLAWDKTPLRLIR